MEALGDAVVEVLAEEWGAIEALGSALGEEEWQTPTECPGWTVRDVLSHLVGTERSLLGEEQPLLRVDPPTYVRNPLGEFNEAWVEVRRAVPGEEVLEEFAEVTGRRLAQMRRWPASRFDQLGPSPVGEAPYREVMRVRVMDCWVHEQDIRVTTKRPGHRRGAPAEMALDGIASAMGYVVGKKAAAPAGAAVRFDVTGDPGRSLDIQVRDGRGVLVQDLAVEPTAVVKMDQETFWRLGCGRVPGETAVLTGLVRLEGDLSLAGRVVDSMAFMI
jgi:uncharacterized protein (TIGR03083 family)